MREHSQPPTSLCRWPWLQLVFEGKEVHWPPSYSLLGQGTGDSRVREGKLRHSPRETRDLGKRKSQAEAKPVHAFKRSRKYEASFGDT